MSSGLKKVAGDRLESVLQKMTDSTLKGLIFGAVITIAMQSSSALMVMLVGLVNSGIMSLLQTVGILSPAVAVTECRKKTVLIMKKANEGVAGAMELLSL